MAFFLDADATGHAPVWPEWTTGFWQCKLRYSNQTQIMAVANEYVRRNIPISLIIIDFYSWNDPVAKVISFFSATSPLHEIWLVCLAPVLRCSVSPTRRIIDRGQTPSGVKG